MKRPDAWFCVCKRCGKDFQCPGNIPARKYCSEECLYPRYKKGDQVDKLTIVRDLGLKNSHRQYECRCECGKVTMTSGNYLKRGLSRSCGCKRYDERPNVKKHEGLGSGVTGYHNTYQRSQILRWQLPDAINEPLFERGKRYTKERVK